MLGQAVDGCEKIAVGWCFIHRIDRWCVGFRWPIHRRPPASSVALPRSLGSALLRNALGPRLELPAASLAALAAAPLPRLKGPMRQRWDALGCRINMNQHCVAYCYSIVRIGWSTVFFDMVCCRCKHIFVSLVILFLFMNVWQASRAAVCKPRQSRLRLGWSWACRGLDSQVWTWDVVTFPLDTGHLSCQ